MARRTLGPNTSWDDIHNYIAYTEASLSIAAADGDKEIGALVSASRKLLAKWEALDADRRSQQRATLHANALVALRDVGLDGKTTALHNDTLGLVKQERGDALFKRLFPKPLSKVVPLALEAQLGVTRTLLIQVAHADTPLALKKAHEKLLTEALNAGEAAVKQREAVKAANVQVSLRVQALREEVNNALLVIEGQLKTIAGQRSLPLSFVNAFFQSPKKATNKKAPGPLPVPVAPPAPVGT